MGIFLYYGNEGDRLHMQFELHELPRGKNEFEQRYKYTVDPSVITVGKPPTVKESTTRASYNISRIGKRIVLDCSIHRRVGEYEDYAGANCAMVRHNREAHKSKGYTLNESR